MLRIACFLIGICSFFLSEPVWSQSAGKAVTQSKTGSTKLPEEEKINRLIAYVAGLKGATFIRNGDEYPAAKAAEHLQMKRRKAGSRVKTAREFIDGLASESYLSGEPYKIRMADGKTYYSRDVLMKELQRLENGK